MIYYEQERANPVGGIYHQWEENLSFNSHLHYSFEFLYVFDGIFELTVDEVDYKLNKGEAIIIFPNQIHTAYANQRSITYVCIFENSLVGEFYRSVKNCVPTSPVFSVESSLVERLASEENSRYFVKSCLYELIALFDKGTEYIERRSKSSEHIGRILTFIAEHHAEQISMRDVAKSIGYDYHYLSNLLQKNMHTTFRTLLNEYRISHAKYLLMTSEKTISAIAEECGYDSLCSFNRNFKEIAATTPTLYRDSVSDNAKVPF